MPKLPKNKLSVVSHQSSDNSLKAERSLVKIGEAANLLGVSIDTLRRWEKSGKLSAIKTPDGTRFYSLKSLKKIVPNITPVVLNNPSPQSPVEVATEDDKSFLESRLEIEEEEEEPYFPEWMNIPGKDKPLNVEHHSSKDNQNISDDNNTVEQIPTSSSSYPTGGQISSLSTGINKRNVFLNLFLVSSLPLVLGALALAFFLIAPQKAQSLVASLPSPVSSVILSGAKDLLRMQGPSLANVNVSETSSEIPHSVRNDRGDLRKSANNSRESAVLAESTEGYFLQINSDTVIEGNLTAPNILYSLTAGDNITISGEQNLTITANIPDSLLTAAPAATQTITPTVPGATGLVIAQASGGTANIFSVTNNAGTSNYLNVTSSGNVGINSSSASKTLYVAGTFEATGDSTVGGAISVSGASTLSGAVTASSTLKVSGDTTLSGALAVSGASTLSGAITGSSTLAISGSSTLSGAVTASSTLAVSGATTLSSTLAVTGATTLSSYLQLAQISAPSTTTDRLYNVSGNLVWNGTNLTAGGSLPVGTQGQTLYNSSGTWTASSNLFHNGSNVGIGTTAPGAKLGFAAATTAAGGIDFGADTNLYRSAANTLSTDDTLSVVSGNLILASGSGNGICFGNTAKCYITEGSGALTIAAGNTSTLRSNGSATFPGWTIEANSISNNAVAGVKSTSTALTSGTILTADHTATWTSTNTISGGIFSATRNETTNTGGALTITGALASFTDNSAQTAGTLTHSADVLRIQQNYASSTGVGLNIAYGGADAGFALRVNDTSSFTDSSPFVIDGTGNVGIGTTAPSFALDVVTSNSSGGVFGIQNTHASGYSAFDVKDSSGTVQLGVGYGNSSASSVYASKSYIAATGSIPLVFITNSNERVRINSAGNVGIGTTAPGAKLDVNGIIRSSGGGGLQIASVYPAVLDVALNAGSGDNVILNNWGDANNPGIIIGTTRTDGTAFQVSSSLTLDGSNLPNNAGTARFLVRGDGNVGIGANTPVSLFDVNRLFNVTSGGNVGIGTTAPNTLLELRNATTSTQELMRINAPTVAGSYSYLTVASTNNPTGDRAVLGFLNQTASGDAGAFLSAGSSASPNSGVFVNASGNVGIGTTAPGAYRLNVNGNTNITGTLTTSSTITATGQLLLSDGSLSAPGLAFSADTDTGIYRIGANIMSMVTGGTNVLSLNGSNVGIGTTAPGAKLDVTDNANGAAFSVTNNTVTTATLGSITSTSLTTGTGLSMAFNGLTTGKALSITSTSTALTSGNLVNLDWSPGSSTTATGDLFKLNIGANGTTTGNLFNILDASSSIFSISESSLTTSLPASFTSPGDLTAAYDINLTNPTASFIKSSAPLTLQAGESFNSSNLTLKTYNQGSVVVDSAVTTGTAVDIQNTTLTTGYGLSFTGPSSTGITGSALYAISDIGSAGKLLNLAPDFSGSAVTGYGIYNAGTDSTANANTNYGYYGSLTMTGNAAKNGYGIYQTVTSSSTTADTLYAANLATSVTGIMTTGTRNVYGLYANPSAGAESTGGTTNVYGGYFKADADVAAGGTVNGYGLYIANGAFDTDGTSTQYGLYVAEPTGADTNYSIYSAGGVNYFSGNVGVGTTAPAVKFQVIGATGDASQSLADFRATSTTGSITSALSIGINPTDPEILIRTAGASGSPRLSLAADSATPALTILPSGTVGIGTTNPDVKLTVRGAVDDNLQTMFKLSKTSTTGSHTTNFHIDVKALSSDPQVVFESTATTSLPDFHFQPTNGTTSMIIKSTGNVGIGTTAPGSKFTVQGGTAVTSGEHFISQFLGASGAEMYLGYRADGAAVTSALFRSANSKDITFGTTTSNTAVTIKNSGNVGIGTTAPSAALEVKAAGTGVIAKFTSDNTTGCTLADGGTISCSSDRNLKKNISELEYGLDTLMVLNPVEYLWKTQEDTAVKSLGFIAQEVEAVIPNLVATDKSNGQKQLNTIGLVPVLAKAIQQQQEQINQLKAVYKIDEQGYFILPKVKAEKIIVNDELRIMNDGVTLSAGPYESSKGEGSLMSASTSETSSEILRFAQNDNFINVAAKLASLDSRLQTLDSTSSAKLAVLGENVASQSAVIASANEAISKNAQELASASAKQTEIATGLSGLRDDVDTLKLKLMAPESLLATGSATLAKIDITEKASILNLEALDATISATFKSLGETFLGKTTIAGDFSIDGTLSITGNSLNSIACHSGLDPESIQMDSRLRGNDNGSGMTSCGVLYIQNSPIASLVDIFNGLVTIDNTGKLSVESLSVGKSTLGSGVIPAGQLTVTIPATSVKSSSKIFLTPTSEMDASLIVYSQTEGSGFKVKLSRPQLKDVRFNWWIVESKE